MEIRASIPTGFGILLILLSICHFHLAIGKSLLSCYKGFGNASIVFEQEQCHHENVTCLNVECEFDGDIKMWKKCNNFPYEEGGNFSFGDVEACRIGPVCQDKYRPMNCHICDDKSLCNGAAIAKWGHGAILTIAMAILLAMANHFV